MGFKRNAVSAETRAVSPGRPSRFWLGRVLDIDIGRRRRKKKSQRKRNTNLRQTLPLDGREGARIRPLDGREGARIRPLERRSDLGSVAF